MTPVKILIVPYATGSTEHGFVPERSANNWDRENVVCTAEITPEEYDVMVGQLEEWCTLQDRLDELIQKVT